MSQWNEPWVLDREAYEERMAIMIEGGADMSITEISSAAAQSAYHTPFAMAATQLIRGNPEPAKELCREAREKLGEEIARELMRAIQDAVKEKQALL